MSRYEEFHRRSVDAPEAVLGRAGPKLIDWQTPPTADPGRQPAAIRPLVRGRHHQPVPQRRRPSSSRRAATNLR